jgi:thiamine pyrophosphate-dependent acetolactate synthase large subunit-like protein
MSVGSGNLLKRRAAVSALLNARNDLLVVSGLGAPTYDVFAAGDHDANFYLWGAMGGASLVGLGLALAQPQRAVAVVTGDGEQLMGLGGLATIAVAAPKNLSIIVLDNGQFGETGGQISHSGLGVNLAQVARSVGFKEVGEITDEGALAAARKRICAKGTGPYFATVRIACEEIRRVLPSRDGVYLKNRMRAHLGFAVT